jgi:hypothetical protein
MGAGRIALPSSEVHRLQEAPTLYVGLDIHDKRTAICVLSETGQIVRRAQVRTIDEIMRILEAILIRARGSRRR